MQEGRKKYLYAVYALLGAAATLILGAVAFWKGLLPPQLLPGWSWEPRPGSTPATAKPLTERVNVLLLGTDANRFDGNTDLIMVASIDPSRKTIHLLSIPRDTRVRIPGHGLEKINAANFLGGPELAVRTVEELLATSIDYYALLTFKGAARIIDRLGGVTVTVPRKMDYDDPYQNLHIHLKPGRQHLNGEKAIQFARFRSYPMGDVARTQQQQYLLQEMFGQLLQSVTPTRLPALVPELLRYVRTNATLADALRLASLFRDREGWQFETMTLPGNFWDEDGVSYWRVDPAKAKKAWRDFLEGRSTPLLDPSLAQPGRKDRKEVSGSVYEGEQDAVPDVVYGPGSGNVSDTVRGGPPSGTRQGEESGPGAQGDTVSATQDEPGTQEGTNSGVSGRTSGGGAGSDNAEGGAGSSSAEGGADAGSSAEGGADAENSAGSPHLP